MTLANELQSLQNIKCDNGKCVLSVYLNTDPADSDQQKGEWKIRLKNGLKKIEEYLEASVEDKNELKAYKNLSKKVEKEIHDNQTNFQKSVVIFASEEQDLWSVHYLQIPVETNFYWEETPQLEGLKEVENKYPHSGVIMPNNHEVRIIDTALGEVNNEWLYEFDSGKEEWSLNEGMGDTNSIMSGATHVDKFQQRFEENQHRFYKDMAQKVEKMKKKHEWKEIHIVGEADMARTFEEVMQTKPASRVEKNLNQNEAKKVLSEVFK